MCALHKNGLIADSYNGLSATWRGKLIVSCQAQAGSALCEPSIMARIARSVVDAGAAGIRAEGPENVAAICQAVQVPIIGIAKLLHTDGRVLITPTFESARALVEAGASAVALDCTARGRRWGAMDRIREIHEQLRVPVLADIATLEEARAAAQAGADFILTTLRGYTPETEHVREFESEFVRNLVQSLSTPVIAEGRIGTPLQALEAFAAGAFAIIVGSAITRPDVITRGFIAGASGLNGSDPAKVAIGVDLGSTNTKFAIARRDGSLLWEDSCPTPAMAGRDALLSHLSGVVGLCSAAAAEQNLKPAAIGIATGGWVDPNQGNVIFATGNLPGWSGAQIRAELERITDLPVAVENDANAMAVAEKRFGLAQSAANFVAVTLGTGVGGGCYVGGRLSRGSHFLGNALGHISVEPGGLPCTCGQSGCLEVYANAAALVRYAGPPFASAAEVARAAKEGHSVAREAIRTYAGYLARGLASLVHVLDPELIAISGGVAEDNAILLEDLAHDMSRLVIGWSQRRLRLAISNVARFGGVMGASAVALDELDRRLRASAG